MRKLILLLGPKSYTIRRIRAELHKINCKTALKDWSKLVLPFPEDIPAVCLPRMTPRVSTIFQLDCIEQLTVQGSYIINRLESILKCDKLSQFMIWRASKKLRALSTIPSSIGTLNTDIALDFINEKGQVVCKPSDRGLGEGILLLSATDPNLRNIITNFLNQFGLLFLQEYIPDQKYDLRTLAIGNNFFQYFRKATTDFRSNISCGGIPVPIEDMNGEIPEIKSFLQQSRQLAKVIMEEIELEIVGIDTALYKNKLLLWEWNPFPGIEGAEKIFGSNVGRTIAVYLKNKLVELYE